MTDNNFLGFNNFIWFTGVVEDRMDPFAVGRVRVRCVGIHTHDKDPPTQARKNAGREAGREGARREPGRDGLSQRAAAAPA